MLLQRHHIPNILDPHNPISGGFICYSVHPPLFAGGLNFVPNFQKDGGGDFTQLHFLEEGWWEIGSGFFQGGGRGLNFYIKSKLKSEIFKDKKVL